MTITRKLLNTVAHLAVWSRDGSSLLRL